MRKNINPKSLKGQDKLNRMLGLMNRMNTLTESKSFSELELIKKSLDKYQGKRKDAAEELGISERTLYRKIKQYNL